MNKMKYFLNVRRCFYMFCFTYLPLSKSAQFTLRCVDECRVHVYQCSRFVLDGNGQVNDIVLLFISYKFVKGFWWHFFYFLFLTETYMVCIYVFLCSHKRNFSWIRQNKNNFPTDTHCKNRTWRYQSERILQWGLWVNISFFVRSNWNFVSGYI